MTNDNLKRRGNEQGVCLTFAFHSSLVCFSVYVEVTLTVRSFGVPKEKEGNDYSPHACAKHRKMGNATSIVPLSI